MSVLGVDIGTTGVKAVVVRDGVLLASAQAEYGLVTPEPGWAELDPLVVWRSAQGVIRRAIKASGGTPDAVGLAGPGEAFVPLDAAGHPVGNAIASFDQRTQELFERVVGAVGPLTFESATGLRPLSHYALFKWLWWGEQRAAVDIRTARFATLAGFVAERLGGKPGIDPSLAMRTLGYDPISRGWAVALLEQLGIDIARLPPILSAGAPCGTVEPAVAANLGIARAAPIVLAGLDQVCAAYGVDLAPSTTLLSLGTTVVVGRAWPVQPRPEAVPGVPHLDGTNWLQLAGSPGGAAAFRWFADTCREAGRSRIQGRSGRRKHSYDALVGEVSNRRTRVLFLPHLGGSRIAFADPAAHGAFVGLTFETDWRDLMRAVLDGVAYEVAMLTGRISDGDAPPRRMLAVGGGSLSPGWMQLIADATAIPIDSTGSRDVAAYGAARAAAGASNAADQGQYLPPIPIKFTVEPRPQWRDYHTNRLSEFRRTHDALRAARV